MYAGCVFVAGISECRDVLSLVRWNTCGHRPDLRLYSHLKEFGGGGGGGLESEPMLSPREKIPST